ncbi:MAG TPA: hypothetical protein VGA59_07840, partial [Ramlibacter sp.]
FINSKVEELSGGKPFRHIDDLISQEQLRRISEDYKRIAGFSLDEPDENTVDAGSAGHDTPLSTSVIAGSTRNP